MAAPILPQPAPIRKAICCFYTLSGSGLIEQNDQRVELPAGSALLLNCRTPQSYCTAPGQDHWHHYWAHLDGAGVANLAEVLQPQGRLSPSYGQSAGDAAAV